MTVLDAWDFVNKGGLLAGSAAFIWALYTGRLYWGKDVKKIEESHAKEMGKAETALKIAQDAHSALVANQLTKLDRLEKWAEERGAK